MWKRVFIYGVLLGLGTLALQGLEYQRLARMHTGEFYLFAVALAFGVLGLVVGMRLMHRPPPLAEPGNPQAQATLGISPRRRWCASDASSASSSSHTAPGGMVMAKCPRAAVRGVASAAIASASDTPRAAMDASASAMACSDARRMLLASMASASAKAIPHASASP